MLKLNKKNWYKEFFSKYYLRFFGHKKALLKTRKEVKFICRVLNLRKGAKILDLACGPGRHALELSKKGFDVTGVDFNKQFLEIANKEARKKGLPLKLIQSDMRSLLFQDEFDAVICMYTSFGYFINEKENTKVLNNVLKSLRKDGLFLLDLPNKYWVLNKIPKKTWQKIKNTYILEERIFNNKKDILQNKIVLINLKWKIKKVSTYLRLYSLKEIKNKLRLLGFKYIRTFGNYEIKTNFHPTKSPRMIVLVKNSPK